LIHRVVKQAVLRVMLPESVVAEKDIVTCQVGSHTVRPVQHRHFNKYYLFSVSDINLVARFDNDKIPILMILATKRLNRVCGAVYWRIGDVLHQTRQRPAVVDFAMVCDYRVYAVKINFVFQV
jgi:hypothetical protein